MNATRLFIQLTTPLILICALAAPLLGQDESQLAALAQAGDFARARTLIAQLIDREPREPRHRYNLACAEARLGFTELALDALDTAVRLGFKDRDLLLGDEDLARIRDLPRFREIANRVPAAAPIAAPKQVPAPKTPAAAKAPLPPKAPAKAKDTAAGALPEAARLTAEGPVGLFFMTRFWIFTNSLEQLLWYFTADGRVFESPGGVFSTAELERSSRRQGRRSFADGKMTVKWSDGKVTESKLEPGEPGTGFAWDGGIFSAIAKPDWSKVSGYFEGGTSFSTGSGGAMTVSGLTLRPDGTFSWSLAASLRNETKETVATAGSARAPVDGKWKGEGYQITLTFADGQTKTYVSFPTPDARNPEKIGMLFFDGSMHLPKQR